MNNKFKHPVTVYNDKAAQEIVPFIMNLLSPKSVIDVGCGVGTWLKSFRENGVRTVVGMDGAYHEKNLIAQNLSETEFVEVNLEENHRAILDILYAKLQTDSCRKFDLVVSLEVAEHLHEQYADSYINLLTALSNCILFSAAIPKQGGDGHVNEQWPEYWVDKLSGKGYKVLDIIRPNFWSNDNVNTWYKQNMFLFVKEETHKNIENRIGGQHSIKYPLNIVHPELYFAKVNMKMGIRSSANSLFSAIYRKLKYYV